MQKLSLSGRAAVAQENVGLAAQRVLLVDAQPSRASIIKRALLESGYELADRLHDVSRILESVISTKPDILVLGVDEPDETVITQMVAVKDACPLPVIVFAEKDTPQIIQQVVQAGVSAFIVDDIQPQRFRSIINIAVARFGAQHALLQELETTRSKLAERKVIERAKGLLMSQRGIPEEEAYRMLRKMAMDKALPLVQVAQNIVDVMKLFESDAGT